MKNEIDNSIQQFFFKKNTKQCISNKSITFSKNCKNTIDLISAQQFDEILLFKVKKNYISENKEKFIKCYE